MSLQSQQVFADCSRLAQELREGGRPGEAVSVLRALQVYLDALPASADGSCRQKTRTALDDLQKAPAS